MTPEQRMAAALASLGKSAGGLVAKHKRAVRDLRIALVVLAVNTVLLLVLSFKYLHAVNMPRERCLHPAFVPTQIEPARKPSDVEVWL